MCYCHAMAVILENDPMDGGEGTKEPVCISRRRTLVNTDDLGRLCWPPCDSPAVVNGDYRSCRWDDSETEAGVREFETRKAKKV